MSTLDPRRIWQVLHLQVLLHGRSLLAYLGPTLAVLFINALSHGESYEEYKFFEVFYIIFLLVGGFIFATSCLPENKSPDGRQAFLTLPASDGEKWVASYLYAGPFFFVAGTLGYWLLTLIVQAVLAIFSAEVPSGFNPIAAFAQDDTFVVYWLGVVPLGLLAAILFNRGAWIKMIGVVFAIALAIAAFAALTFRIVFYKFFTGFWYMPDNAGLRLDGPSEIFDPEDHAFLTTAVLGLFFLAVSYFRFHEKEV